MAPSSSIMASGKAMRLDFYIVDGLVHPKNLCSVVCRASKEACGGFNYMEKTK